MSKQPPKKKANKKKTRRDVIEIARDTFERLIGEKLDGSPLDASSPVPDPTQPPKNPHAVALSKLGASKGGQARAKKLSVAKRKAIAKKAAAARWGKKR